MRFFLYRPMMNCSSHHLDEPECSNSLQGAHESSGFDYESEPNMNASEKDKKVDGKVSLYQW